MTATFIITKDDFQVGDDAFDNREAACRKVHELAETQGIGNLRIEEFDEIEGGEAVIGGAHELIADPVAENITLMMGGGLT